MYEVNLVYRGTRLFRTQCAEIQSRKKNYDNDGCDNECPIKHEHLLSERVTDQAGTFLKVKLVECIVAIIIRNREDTLGAVREEIVQACLTGRDLESPVADELANRPPASSEPFLIGMVLRVKIPKRNRDKQSHPKQGPQGKRQRRPNGCEPQRCRHLLGAVSKIIEMFNSSNEQIDLLLEDIGLEIAFFHRSPAFPDTN